MDLIDTEPGSNAHDFTVSEISGAVKRSIEGQFGHVRVRGEIGRVSRPGSGHVYFDLKDDRAVLAAVCWKGQAARLAHRPEEGIEVIATGRLTTFPGQSKYQMIVEQIEPAGAGALMAMLEKRRKALAAEGLFDDSRKRALPYLPQVIGVVTSPSGAVIRDILHRLRDRFPTHVLIWPVAVQGEACASQVAAAIRGFNALPEGGALPRPDLLIVARGGGSLEDLWGFNDEAVVRAAADSAIPLISAVGHETDTTLIDFAADRRAPTPTAAAEMAVPVRAELAQRLAEQGLRMARAAQGRVDHPRQRLRDLARGLGRPQALTEGARQRLDLFSDRLDPALRSFLRRQRDRLAAQPMPVAALRAFMRQGRAGLNSFAQRLAPASLRRLDQARDRLRDRGARLDGALARLHSDARRRLTDDRTRLEALTARLIPAMARNLTARAERLERIDRLRQTLGYRETLARGFAILRDGDGRLVASADAARALPQLQVELHDGRLTVQPVDDASEPAPRKRRAAAPPAKDNSDPQQSLF
ncbi:MAG: exodeoxyribonuclease VII large subunit [Paracoccus sp. (in: a-proteobacteria)]|uniref:exodeoxyribonuclease VII large subunit n=1 Tax=Paracoccus sp. TaxID=267 RepID=UPI0026DEB07F|nr:exodeoxyribonuclease VII large subunit [Paracoccus sp. (in: a-proteobacteria)]MDO5621362.1 exodeoxyribonuclease VII large subunit [Paracoccus sp. (in: a-proteobacteria)]